MVSRTSSPTQRRSRPKDRRDQIATAAAVAFSERGYHGVSVEDIATHVGITKSALYRHFSGKYALFLNSALMLLDALEEALTPGDTEDDSLRRDELDTALSAVIATTITHRRTAGIYRWERRYLREEDRFPIRIRAWDVNRRLRSCLLARHPDVTDDDAFVLVVSMLSAIGSITAHNLTLSPRCAEQLLIGACSSLAATRFVWVPETAPAPETDHPTPAARNMREDLLQASIELFHRNGYAEIGVEEIGAAAGLPASGVYRYFPSKADILAAAFYRAIDRLEAAIGEVLRAHSDPLDALNALTAVYVDLSFSQRELMSVYFAELINVPPGPRADLRLRQRVNIEQWADLVRQVRPELSVVESRFLMYAALNLVPDLGLFLGTTVARQQASRVRELMMAVLVGEVTDKIL